MQISEHFSLEELTRSETAVRKGLDNTASPWVIENLTRLCVNVLEPLREVISHAIYINSAYRSPAVNKEVHGDVHSQHVFGCAADITVKGMTPRQVCEAVIASGIEFDQLILEFNIWTHISIPNAPNGKPRMEALIRDKNGYREFV